MSRDLTGMTRTEVTTGNSAHHLVVNASWLMRLRWVAVAGQLATIGVTRACLNVPLPITPLLAIIGFTALTNLALWCWLQRLDHSPASHRVPTYGQELLAAVLALDLVMLTALLYYTGGAANPFSVFYLVNLALCAIVLPQYWGWALAALAVAGLGGLLIFHVHLPTLEDPLRLAGRTLSRDVTLSDLGQVVATATCAIVIIHFVKRVARQLETTQAELRRVEQDRSRNEKLEALGTLAGGAAHELATPLSTIAVVAKEMAHHLNLSDHPAPDDLVEDVALIRTEVDHCRKILQRMTAHAGQQMGEEISAVTVVELIHAMLDDTPREHRIELVLPPGIQHETTQIPLENVAQALRAVLHNALDASGDSGKVLVRVEADASCLRITICDEGPGMSAETLARAGEPFFTTKEPGRGMGLGLFLARSVLERLGGRLLLVSSPGEGATATLEIPRRSQYQNPQRR
jgi:two-component system sensor histidine kinase RegB